jgi:hypothetical protein
VFFDQALGSQPPITGWGIMGVVVSTGRAVFAG